MLLDRCSVFASGFDLQSACAVAGFDDVDDYAILDLLDALVRKSLVVADRSGGRTRFFNAGDDPPVRRGDNSWLAARPPKCWPRMPATSPGAKTKSWPCGTARDNGRRTPGFTTELVNLRTAFRWAADHADLDTAATIATYAAFLLPVARKL